MATLRFRLARAARISVRLLGPVPLCRVAAKVTRRAGPGPSRLRLPRKIAGRTLKRGTYVVELRRGRAAAKRTGLLVVSPRGTQLRSAKRARRVELDCPSGGSPSALVSAAGPHPEPAPTSGLAGAPPSSGIAGARATRGPFAAPGSEALASPVGAPTDAGPGATSVVVLGALALAALFLAAGAIPRSRLPDNRAVEALAVHRPQLLAIGVSAAFGAALLVLIT